MNNSIITRYLSVAVIALSVGLYTYAQPTQSPPAGNTFPPVNVSTTSQVKSGGLGVGALVIKGGTKLGTVDTSTECNETTEGTIVYNKGALTICSNLEEISTTTSSEYWTQLGRNISYGGKDSGTVSIGTDTAAAGVKLTVNGNLAAAAFCNANGNNCILQQDVGRSYWGRKSGNLHTNASQSVGIGTDNPSSRLTIQVDETSDVDLIALRNIDSGAHAVGISFLNGSEKSTIRAERTATDGGADLLFSTANSVGSLTEYVRITEKGYVGIGYTDPKLHLAVAGQIGAREFCDPDGNNCIQPENISSALWKQNGNNLYRLGGNIGIGVTTPQENLHTNLNLRVDGGHIYSNDQDLFLAADGRLYFDSNNAEYVQFGLRNSSDVLLGSVLGVATSSGRYVGITNAENHWILINEQGKRTQLRIAGVPVLHLEPGGMAVGTSTISGDLALDVRGKVGASEYCDEEGLNCFFATSLGALWEQDTAEGSNDIYRSSGAVSIGGSSPDGDLTVDVEGAIGAVEYCDNLGANCVSAATLGSLQAGKGSIGAVNAITTSLVSKYAGLGGNGTSEGSGNNQDNLFLGNKAGYSNTDGNNNIFLGERAGYSVTTGSNNIAIGAENLPDNTASNQINIANFIYKNTGKQLGINDSTPDGSLTLDVEGQMGATEYCDNDGANCVKAADLGGGGSVRAITRSLVASFAGPDGLGTSAGISDYRYNVLLGWYAGYRNSNGQNNLFLGNMAGRSNTDGNNNIFLGERAGYSVTTGSNNIAIGAENLPDNTASNQINIGNSIYQDSQGNIGIGISTPAAKLHVNGDVRSTAFLQISDQSLKTNVEAIDPERVLDLRGVRFTWKQDGRRDYGFIAQEVEKVFPALVSVDSDTGARAVAYPNITALLIELAREQDQKIIELEERINALEQR